VIKHYVNNNGQNNITKPGITFIAKQTYTLPLLGPNVATPRGIIDWLYSAIKPCSSWAKQAMACMLLLYYSSGCL